MNKLYTNFADFSKKRNLAKPKPETISFLIAYSNSLRIIQTKQLGNIDHNLN